MSRAQKYIVAVKKSGFSLSVTDFTQSLGSELLVNPGSPYAFSGGNPTSWTVTGESGSDPEITEVGSGQAHGGGGTGAVNAFSSVTNNAPNVRQANVIPAGICQMGITLSNVTAGLIGIQVGATIVQDNIAVSRRILRRVAALSQFVVLPRNAPNNMTWDHTTARMLTVNAPVTAIADGQFNIYFPTPVSPLPGDEINLIFRMNAGVDQEFVTCWAAQYIRNDAGTNWNTAINRYAGGTFNNHTGGSNVGAANGIRVRTNGNTIQMFTLVDGVETQRGSTVTASNLATNIMVNVIYTSAFAPTLLEIASA